MNPVRINFLAAADGTPLTKQYIQLPNGEYEVKPYPMVRSFNSFEYTISNLTDWYNTIKAHSELNHCFLKGTLDKKLVNESRAGHTNPVEPTSTVVLDLDFFDGFSSFEDFLTKLDPMFNNVSYIRQHSTSAGIMGAAGLRGHLFFLTTKPQNLAQLKVWLQYKNLTVPALADRLELTASGMSLRFPLDVTTCQADKIIYTALPLCDNFEDPIRDERLSIVQKGKELLEWNAPFINPQLISEMIDDKVQELRTAAGLKKRGSKYGVRGGKDVLQNPDTATVTGIKEGRGFVYLNLNGGDS